MKKCWKSCKCWHNVAPELKAVDDYRFTKVTWFEGEELAEVKDFFAKKEKEAAESMNEVHSKNTEVFENFLISLMLSNSDDGTWRIRIYKFIKKHNFLERLTAAENAFDDKTAKLKELQSQKEEIERKIEELKNS